MDRTEVTNAAYDVFNGMSELTGLAGPQYVTNAPLLHNLALPRSPVSGIFWVEALWYCRFVGKSLPTKEQWQKALRGGDVLPDGSQNPAPRRNLPWIADERPAPANLSDTSPQEIQPVGSFPRDRSPYGVVDLAGNVMEWTLSLDVERSPGFRVARGGEFEHTTSANVVDYMAIENDRAIANRQFSIGVRCVTN
jgi:formylglycine-generating enzyme required for sulfatase activity